MTRVLRIEADGGSRGNPGDSGSGAVIIDLTTGELLAEIAEFIGTATNNVAEYRAVLAAVQLSALIDESAELQIALDSKLVVEQMSGRWRIKNESLFELANQLQSAIARRKVDFTWMPREQNYRADALANEAMDSRVSVVRRFDTEDIPNELANSEPVFTFAEKPTEKTSAAHLEFNSEKPSSVRAERDVKAQLTTVILVRHGRTALTESHKISGRGGTDPELSVLGLDDARRVAEEITQVGVAGFFSQIKKPTVIVSSPIMRARQTAEAISKAINVPVAVEQGLAEIDFGDWDGYTNQEVAEKWGETYEAWRGDINIAPPGTGESLVAFDARVQKARHDILARYEGQTVVVVAHVMPIRGFIKAAIDANWPIYWRQSVAPCSISVARFWADEAAELTCTNYTTHL